METNWVTAIGLYMQGCLLTRNFAASIVLACRRPSGVPGPVRAAGSGLNSQFTNLGYRSEIISHEAQKKKEALITASKPDLCTSCGYCLAHCPEKINIRSYMEIYNHYQLTDSVKGTKDKSSWYHQFGPIYGDDKRPSDCTECLACEEACTQFLNITDRLKWLDEHL